MASIGPDIFARISQVLADVQHADVDRAQRSAAVLFGLFDDGEQVRVLLTKRAANLRRHSGEVSFPGGISELFDADLQQTAAREAFEEVGIERDAIEFLGSLDDMMARMSGFLIRPYVARLPNGYPYRCDTNEVERILTPPLSLFADESNRRVQMWERDGRQVPIYFFDYEGDVVWGATARMIVALLERLDGRIPTFGYVPPPASVEEDIDAD